jgi:hypothetical protein
MLRARISIVFGFCLFALAVSASAQNQNRKPGLWAVTTTITYPSTGAASAGRPSVGPYTINVCLTQALIDKYGAPLPQIGSCTVTKLDKKANSVAANLSCTGAATGTATMESSWTADHATGKIHFIGTAPVATEWNSASTSVFKSSDCGSVQPFPMPN